LDEDREEINGSNAFKVKFGEGDEDEANKSKDESELFRLESLKEEVSSD